MMAFRKIQSSLKKLINIPKTTKYIKLKKPYNHCGYCDTKLDIHGWCEYCKKNCLFEHNFDKWTSGNKQIDKFIHKTQRYTRYLYGNTAEWIEFSQFSDMEKIGVGGFGQVYKAN